MRSGLLSILAAFLLLTPLCPAGEAGSLALRPGEPWPPPRQRGLGEVEAVPEEILVCPVCNREVAAPLVDTLMRRRAADAAPLPWRMDAGAGRDADLCPYPAPDRVAFQADVVLCPDCGYANRRTEFAAPLPIEVRNWVFATLRPNLRQVETALLGKRAAEMSEEEVLDFFSRQTELPDTVRTEHRRIVLTALHAPALERVSACLQAAWSSRREVSAPPRGAFFARRADVILPGLDQALKPGDGVHSRLDMLNEQLRRWSMRKNKAPFAAADNMTGRFVRAGLEARLGFLHDAEQTLHELHLELRERFLKPDQDPLWDATAPRAANAHRLRELETIRTDAENEVFVRLELVRREREQVLAAAESIRDALRNGELRSDPDSALFHAYLMGECLRRAGDLPLASEWFKNLQSLLPPDAPLAEAAARQLALVGEEAGDAVDLLSALGRDGELFDLLRRICRNVSGPTR